jgi:hypothetical protein
LLLAGGIRNFSQLNALPLQTEPERFIRPKKSGEYMFPDKKIHSNNYSRGQM